MFYDLNLPYINGDQELSRKLHFLSELGYGAVALNHNISGKLTDQSACAIPNPLPIKDVPAKLEIKRRVTLSLSEPLQNARLNALAALYDVLALRPTDEKTLQLACGSYECDIISLDLSQRLGFHFRLKMFSEAVKNGKRIEMCYAQGVVGDSNARRNLISNATQLIRATRGRGLIISSEAKTALGLRGPWDVINLAAIWGLGQERGHEAMAKEARSVVARAQLKQTSYRGVVNIVYGGEPVQNPSATESKGSKTIEIITATVQKRKADALGVEDAASIGAGDKSLSKTQQKKRAKLAAKAKAKAEAEENTSLIPKT